MSANRLPKPAAAQSRGSRSATTGNRAASAGSLPVEMTGFVGRRREVGEIRRRLADARLVTLTGVGGVGKTRLAQRVATEVRRAFPDGVWFIDLTAVRAPESPANDVMNPEMLANLVSTELGLSSQSTDAAVEALTGQLARRQLLLVLDNCEHLPACWMLADAVLRACPQVRILATSREPLNIAGEITYPVPPLATPDSGREPELAELMACESVALFLARADSTAPGFQLTEDNRAMVAALCRQLDGLPLAIELATTWLRALSPQQILERLDDRFTLLARGNRAAPDRQQTLRACVDWSLKLCTKAERVLWRRLAVYVGGCELDAIEGVCTDDELAESDLLNVVAGLVDKSILIRDTRQHVTRYRMLDTLRDYGLQCLRDSGEYDLLMRRHRDWYRDLVERVHALWVRDPDGTLLDRARRARSNLRAAIEFSLADPAEPEQALRIVLALPWLTWGRGQFTEGRQWLNRALAHTPVSIKLRARALLMASDLTFIQGDLAAATRMLEQAMELTERLDDPVTLADTLLTQSIAAFNANDVNAAVEHLRRARAILSPGHDSDLRFRVLLTSAVTSALAGDREQAAACREEALAMTGGGYAIRQAMWFYGMSVALEGDLEEAARCEKEYLRFSRDRNLDEPYATGFALQVLAWVAADRHEHQRAGILLGATEGWYADIGAPMRLEHMTAVQRERERRSREALGEAGFEDAVRQGRGLAYNDVLAYALDEVRAAAPLAEKATSQLTRREREVANLVAQGATNKDIASTLVISLRTAEAHVENILSKLGFTSRVQIASWMTAQQATAAGSPPTSPTDGSAARS